MLISHWLLLWNSVAQEDEKHCNFLRKKGRKGSFVRRSAGLSNDWKLGVRKAGKFDSSFRERAQHVTVFLIKEQSRMVGWPAVIQRSIVNNIVMERKTSIFDRFAKRRNERRMRERAKRERKGRRRRISTLSLADSSFPLFRSDASDARSNPRRKGNYYPGGW